MKYLFMVVLILLIACSVATSMVRQRQAGSVPVLYWVTDNNPARKEQLRRFHAWLKKNDYPPMEVRTDSANRDVSKMVVQGVSGMGGDILEIWAPSGDMLYFQQMGILEDITDAGREWGFDPSHTFPSAQAQITLRGRQYMFPCNVGGLGLWANLATFRKFGQAPPPWRWTVEEFERRGKDFVAAANPPGKPRSVFFVNYLRLDMLARSFGATTFNETLTEPTIDDEGNVRAMNLIRKWTYEDHLIPSAAEVSAFATDSGYGGASAQLFNAGQYAMLLIGRNAIIQFRKFGSMELAVAEPPHGGFPNTNTGTRGAGIYAGSAYKDLARYFLAFLASEDYNRQIVDDGDSLPPNPRYTDNDEFRRPPNYPNEWNCHQPFLELENIGIPTEFSPFVSPNAVSRIIRLNVDRFMNDRCTAEVAARDSAKQIRGEMQRSLRENPSLLPRYEELVKRQKQIDQLRKDGRPVPLEWIENPFHQRYYQFKGWVQQ